MPLFWLISLESCRRLICCHKSLAGGGPTELVPGCCDGDVRDPGSSCCFCFSLESLNLPETKSLASSPCWRFWPPSFSCVKVGSASRGPGYFHLWFQLTDYNSLVVFWINEWSWNWPWEVHLIFNYIFSGAANNQLTRLSGISVVSYM